MSDPVQFRVEGTPIPKGRPRCGKSVRTPQRTKDAEASIAAQAAVQWRRPPSGAAFGLECAFVLPTRRKVDVDNLVKTVMDALNDIVWVDDAQVVELKAKKHFSSSKQGYTVIRVWEVP